MVRLFTSICTEFSMSALFFSQTVQTFLSSYTCACGFDSMYQLFDLACVPDMRILILSYPYALSFLLLNHLPIFAGLNSSRSMLNSEGISVLRSKSGGFVCRSFVSKSMLLNG